MNPFLIALIVISVLTAMFTAAMLICFCMAFYMPESSKKSKKEFDIPPGKIYLPYKDRMISWIKEVRNLPCEKVHIKSFDSLDLYGNYYEHKKGAPLEIMFHGYRGNVERDLCGGVQRAFSLGRNVLIVHQRAAGESGGNIISFGINESRDCLSWIDFAISKFGKDVKIVLTGISMGAATVCIAAGYDLPKNVVGVLADCGYTSASDIIKKVIKQRKMPVFIVYPLIKLSAKLIGKFDLESVSPVESVKKAKVPIIFIHGDDDRYVPHYMSVQNYEACVSPKQMVTVKGAGHGMAYLLDEQGYLDALSEFFTKNGLETKKGM